MDEIDNATHERAQSLALLEPKKVRPTDWLDLVQGRVVYGVKVLLEGYERWHYIRDESGCALVFDTFQKRDRFINEVQRRLGRTHQARSNANFQ